LQGRKKEGKELKLKLNMNLRGRAAIVTGGSSGIGQAICGQLAGEGTKIIFTYNSNEAGADETLKILGKGNFKYKVDIRNETEIEKFFAFVKQKFGKIDILVNNAGKTLRGDNLDIGLWREVFDITLFPAVKFTQEALKIMSKGKILNISSVYGEDKAAWKGLVPFSAAKSALNNFTVTMAKNLAPNILVNGIMPGYVLTPLWGKMNEDKIKSNSSEQLINRFIKPEEIATMAVAIIKNDAMTGEVVVVDGGLSLKTV